MGSVKSGNGWDLLWIDLKIPDTNLNGPSNLRWHCHQFYFFSNIKKIIFLNILMMLNKLFITSIDFSFCCYCLFLSTFNFWFCLFAFLFVFCIVLNHHNHYPICCTASMYLKPDHFGISTILLWGRVPNSKQVFVKHTLARQSFKQRSKPR